MNRLLRRVPSWRLLLTCFAVIALLFAATKGVTWARGRVLHAAIERAMDDALTSAELISRLGRDLEGERALFDTHILEHENAGMARVETRLNALELDFSAAAAAYAPLADDPEEARVWQTLQARRRRRAPARAADARALARQPRHRRAAARWRRSTSVTPTSPTTSGAW